jgi:hypothetical protein
VTGIILGAEVGLGAPFVDRLERGVVSDLAVAQREPLRRGDAFADRAAADDLCVPEKLGLRRRVERRGRGRWSSLGEGGWAGHRYQTRCRQDERACRLHGDLPDADRAES